MIFLIGRARVKFPVSICKAFGVGEFPQLDLLRSSWPSKSINYQQSAGFPFD